MDGHSFDCIVADNSITRDIIQKISSESIRITANVGSCEDDAYRAMLIECLDTLTD